MCLQLRAVLQLYSSGGQCGCMMSYMGCDECVACKLLPSVLLDKWSDLLFGLRAGMSFDAVTLESFPRYFPRSWGALCNSSRGAGFDGALEGLLHCISRFLERTDVTWQPNQPLSRYGSFC